ncbi:MAG TPA: hypothetical protein VEO55_01620, partial [Candidatus Dormibacteraeota bacterium]|nr:hypothetical protein [Candidatus Dormibacteraeota bacterium]
MAKKRKHGGVNTPAIKPASRIEGFASPFKELKTMLAKASKTVAVPSPPAPVKAQPLAQNLAQVLPDEVLDDEAILRRALEGVRPLNGDRRIRTPI